MIELFGYCSRDDAVSAFGPRRGDLCDGQFVTTDADMLCFFELGAATVSDPHHITWAPQSWFDINPWRPSGPPTWLPTAEQYRIFLRRPCDEQFAYLGKADLSCSATGPDLARNEVCFELADMVPKDLWLHFGGFDGWKISGDIVEELKPDDISGIDRALSGAQRTSFFISITRYEHDELRLRTNSTRAVLNYRMLGTGTFGRRVVGELPRSSPIEVFAALDGSRGGFSSPEYTLPK